MEEVLTRRSLRFLVFDETGTANIELKNVAFEQDVAFSGDQEDPSLGGSKE